jgi:hypothetical protein
MNKPLLAWLLVVLFLPLGTAFSSGAQAQSPGFTHAKLSLRKKRDRRYLRKVKLYAADSRADVFLRYRGKDPQGKGTWIVFAEPGGQIDIFDWQSIELCARSVQAQQAVEVQCLPDTTPGWLITTLSDTFRLAGFQQDHRQAVAHCTLSQVMHLPAGQTTLPLMHFSYQPQERKWLEIDDLQSLNDIDAQVRILAALMAAIRLPRLSTPERSVENR